MMHKSMQPDAPGEQQTAEGVLVKMGLAPIERDTLDKLVNDSPRRILARMNRLGHKSTLKEARALKDFGTLTAMIVGMRKQGQQVPQVIYAKLEALRCTLPKALRNELTAIT